VKLDNILNAETIILLPDENKKKLRVVCPPEFEYDEKEQAASLWSYEHEEMAGRGTETLTTARRLYVPLKTHRGIVGILGIEGKKGVLLKDLEFRQLLDALLAQSALAIERARLAEEMEEAIITRERESLRSILLSSISQDLKTPLAAVIGSVSALKAAGKKLVAAAQDGLIEIILDESEKLNQFIANLLEMTKLETGSVIPRIELVDIYELVNYSVNKAKKMLGGHPVKRDIPANLPLIKADFMMIEQVISNLLSNAAKYSEADSEIDIIVREEKGSVVLDVRDHGIGIPHEELGKVFYKFYRVKFDTRNKISGTGLGLSLCQAIIEAHDAKIEAILPEEGGGSILRITFPATLTTRKLKIDQNEEAAA